VLVGNGERTERRISVLVSSLNKFNSSSSQDCNCKPKFSLPGPRGPGASKAQPPRGLVGHCTSGRPLNPPLIKRNNVHTHMYVGAGRDV